MKRLAMVLALANYNSSARSNKFQKILSETIKPSLSPKEIREYIKRVRSKILENPIINLDLLGDLGTVLASIGIVKDYPALRLLGDLIIDLPEKLRPLLSLRYSLIGTIGEVQALAERLSREALEELNLSLEELEEMIERGDIDDARLLRIIGVLYELVNVKIPSITAITEEE